LIEGPQEPNMKDIFEGTKHSNSLFPYFLRGHKHMNQPNKTLQWIIIRTIQHIKKEYNSNVNILKHLNTSIANKVLQKKHDLKD
jgi:hypothetical protein